VPSVRPWRRPASTSTASCSICWRGERPYPCWRRLRSASIASRSSARPAGRPLRIATSAGPRDSPAVARRSVMAPSLECRSLAVAFAVRTVLVVFFDRPAYVFPDPLPFRRLGHDGFWHVGGATIQARSLFVAAAALLLAAAGGRLLQRTRFGRALEAIAQDFDAAVLVGLPVKRLVGLAFALAGVWASLAAVLAAPSG